MEKVELSKSKFTFPKAEDFVLKKFLHVFLFCFVFLTTKMTSGCCPISYPESSGFLVSGRAPGETLENSKRFEFFIGCSVRNGLHCFTTEILR